MMLKLRNGFQAKVKSSAAPKEESKVMSEKPCVNTLQMFKVAPQTPQNMLLMPHR